MQGLPTLWTILQFFSDPPLLFVKMPSSVQSSVVCSSSTRSLVLPHLRLPGTVLIWSAFQGSSHFSALNVHSTPVYVFSCGVKIPVDANFLNTDSLVTYVNILIGSQMHLSQLCALKETCCWYRHLFVMTIWNSDSFDNCVNWRAMLLEFCDLTNVLLLYSSAKQLLGRCYRLEMIQCRVFARAMMLFGLHITTADDEYVGQQQMYGTVSKNFIVCQCVCNCCWLRNNNYY